MVPDLLVGTSVGALNAALVALDPENGATRLAALWAGLRAGDVFVRSRGRRVPVFDQSGLRDLVGSVVGDARFEDTRIPLGVVVTDVRTLSPAVLHRGPLVPALLASSAIPLLFPAVEIDGRRCVDGGYTSPMPVGAALRRGARTVLTLAAAGLPRLVWDPPGRGLVRSGTVIPLVESGLRERRPGDFLEFARTADLVESGRLAAVAALRRAGVAASAG